MKGKIWLFLLIAAMFGSFLTGAHARDWRDEDGAVYAMTNAPDGNEVVVFSRDDDGLLTKVGSVPTGGAGSGGGLDPLASQGSLVLSQDNRWLLAVNAGSNEVSVFRVRKGGLDLVDKVSSGGNFPVSVTVFHDLVYVLNADAPSGTSANIAGFYMTHRGRLIPLANSTRPLGGGGFAQVGFDLWGDTLVVTDKANNRILVYSVGKRGLPAVHPTVSTSSGAVPFGFVFDRQGHLLVVEAGSNAVSSYSISRDGRLRVISPSVPNGQQAACWITASRDRYLYTANPGTSSISSYALNRSKGKVTLLEGVAGNGSAPLDLATDAAGRFLYAVDPGNGSVDMFKIRADGSLTALGAVGGDFAVFAQGMAAR